jgi:hypothetical protein
MQSSQPFFRERLQTTIHEMWLPRQNRIGRMVGTLHGQQSAALWI